MYPELSPEFSALQREVQRIFRAHREFRAILTALYGSAHRLRAMSAAHEAFFRALSPEGSMSAQDQAVTHVLFDWISAIDCLATGCHHLGAALEPRMFDTSDGALRRITLRKVAQTYHTYFSTAEPTAELVAMLESRSYELAKSYRHVLAHRQMLSRELWSQDYAADRIPINPKAHPGDWQFTMPLGAFMKEERTFLESWMPRGWAAMTRLLEQRAALL
jgi:hypothetical protein